MKDKTTAENIICFPKPSRGGQTQSKEERKAALSEEQFKRSDANARTVVMRKFEDRRKKLNASERITVARNLLRILDELEQGSPSVSKREVLKVAGLVHGPTDSTKSLYYLAFDASKTGLTPEQRKTRIKALGQNINKHVNVVRAAASLSGKNEWSMIRQLIEGTSYSPLQQEIETIDEDVTVEGWNNITNAIQSTSNNISRKYDLPPIFKLTRDLGRIDRLTEIRSRSVGNNLASLLRQCDLQKSPLPALVRADELQPRPSLYLGEIRVCDDIPCTMHLQPVYLGEDGEEEAREVEFLKRLLEAGLENPSVKGIATPVMQAWLDLLPLGRENRITPALCLKSNTYVASAEEFTQLAPVGGDQWRIGEVVGEFAGPIEQGNNFVDSDSNVFANFDEFVAELDICAEFESPLGAAYDGSSHARSAARGLWVGLFDDWAKTCLSKPVFRSDTRLTTWIEPEIEDLSVSDFIDAFTFFPSDTMAALLERSLFYAPDETACLDYLLDEKAHLFTRELEESIEKARTLRRERLDELRRE